MCVRFSKLFTDVNSIILHKKQVFLNVKDIHIKNVFQYIKVIESFSMRMLKSVFALRRGVVVSGAVV